MAERTTGRLPLPPHKARLPEPEPLQLWGGHECSVIRVGDEYRDQTILTGHQHRLSDLERFASLGLKRLRYPVLWERVSPRSPGERDFRWSDEWLEEIRRLGMKPIVGVSHHGSGPRYTSLIDETFAPGLAAHARAVAERYPWVEDWNPVNEPLTTARFSCLYGVWYPHGSRDERMFWTALLNQINAVRLAMREIRQVNPVARLVQTEDLGFTHTTPPMAEQAAFENERRWITWDLLAGRVTPEHSLWQRIAKHGLDRELHELADDPCPADLLGANYHSGSERFIDHHVAAYPNTSVFAAGGRNLVVRSGPLFSCDDDRNFAMQILNDLADGTPVVEADDCYQSPTYAADLVDAVLDLLIDGETGIWHVTHPGRMSGAEFARTLAEHAGLDASAVQAIPAKEMGCRARRPRDVTLASMRGNLVSEVQAAIDRFLADTHHAAFRKTPHPSVDLRDPVLNDV